MITTLITTYHRPQLLKRAVESVLKQTYPHFKVCVYDNGSDDETKAIMKEFEKQDSRVFYHRHPENIGMMNNYAYAFSKIDTPYFSFLSDDDYLYPCFYETALQGFTEFPDAAFSACGIKGANDKDEVIATSLIGWERNGYYTSTDAIFEMIEKKGWFPIPTGVLFQQKFVKDISPDWSKDIQLMWDPDYLLQIAARFPVVINKKECGFYYIHEQSFASSYYLQLNESSQQLDGFMIANHKMHQRLMQIPSLTPAFKKRVNLAFINLIGKYVKGLVVQYILKDKPDEATYAARSFYNFYGSNKYSRILLALTKTYEGVPCIRPPLRNLVLYLKKGKSILTKLIKKLK